jgi:hypothetical protein
LLIHWTVGVIELHLKITSDHRHGALGLQERKVAPGTEAGTSPEGEERLGIMRGASVVPISQPALGIKLSRARKTTPMNARVAVSNIRRVPAGMWVPARVVSNRGSTPMKGATGFSRTTPRGASQGSTAVRGTESECAR